MTARTYFPFAYWPLKYLPGWHWPNISHGHRAYRGVGGPGNVDFEAPVGFAQAGATSVSLVGLGHTASTRYTYVVRPVSGNGWLETADLSCTCEVETDAEGEWLGDRPAPVEWLAADVLDGGKIKLSWRWRKPYGGCEPEQFRLYCANGPNIVPGDLQATAPFVSEGDYSHTFVLEDGNCYWFAVTASGPAGTESHLSAVVGPRLADATAPNAPDVSVATTF